MVLYGPNKLISHSFVLFCCGIIQNIVLESMVIRAYQQANSNASSTPQTMYIKWFKDFVSEISYKTVPLSIKLSTKEPQPQFLAGSSP